MAMLQRSRAEDSVDRYNHTYSLLFLLMLSVVTWLLPLSPYLQPKPEPHLSLQVAIDTEPAKAAESMTGSNRKVRVQASCWCPVEFITPMVTYTNQVCAAGFQRALKGQNANDETSIYHLGISTIPGDEDKPFIVDSQPGSKDQAGSLKEQKINWDREKVMKKMQHTTEEEQQEDRDNVWRFIRVETPLALFLLAVGIAIPYLIWTLLSSLMGGVNVHETLSVGVVGAGLDRDSRRQLYLDVADAAARSLGACTWMGSALYLLLKLFAFVAALVGLLIVRGDLLPRARELNDSFNSPQNMQKADMSLSENKFNIASDSSNDSPSIADDYDGMVFLCVFQIISLQNLHSHTVQCLFNVEEEQETQPAATEQVKTATQLNPMSVDRPALEMYETLFLIVQTHLLILAIVNSISLISWLAKLFFKSKASSGPTSLPLDAVLLLEMARLNAGPEVGAALAQTWPVDKTSDKGEEAVALNEQI